MKKIVELFQTHPDWRTVRSLCQQLNEAGHQAYIAGGAVRDALMGRMPHDFDIATSAKPDEVESLFEKTVAVGKAFGVILVVVGEKSFEVATFRSDGIYRDGRRPESVSFSNPKEDSARRDFTVNALFFDPMKNEIVDYHGSREDISLKLIRAVGDPEKRFEEDRLRLLRAIRFAAQLDFKIEDKTWSALRRQAGSVHVVSKERQTEELTKLWKTNAAASGFSLLLMAGLAENLFSGFSFISDPSRVRLFQEGVRELSKEPYLIWTWLFYVEASISNFKSAPNVEKLIENYRLDKNLSAQVRFVLRSRCNFNPENTESLLILDHLHGMAFLKMISLESRLQGQPLKYQNLVNRFQDLSLPSGHLPEPLIRGDDLAKLGIKSGPEMGPLLHQLYTWQLERKIKSKTEALEEARRLTDK